MKRLLFVDFVSPWGHVNFNNIYINALNKSGEFAVDFLVQQDYDKLLQINNRHSRVYNFPKFDFIKKNLYYRLKYLFHQIKMQHFCKQIIKKGCYDTVFISSFYLVTFSLFKSKTAAFAVCHNEIDDAINKRMVYILKLIGKNVSFVAINKQSYNFLSNMGLRVVSSIHGLPPIMDNRETTDNTIFIPINSAKDPTTIKYLLSSSFNGFLVSNSLKLILKEAVPSHNKFSNIKYIPQRIDEGFYKKLFLSSKIILLPYEKADYNYRCSAMLLEALSNDKLVIVPDIPVFREYIINGDLGLFFYKDVNELISIIKHICDEGLVRGEYLNLKEMYSIDYLSCLLKNALI